MNRQIETSDVASVDERVVRSGSSIVIPLEKQWYRIDDQEAGNRQLVVADPDGYLPRLFEDLGTRSLADR